MKNREAAEGLLRTRISSFNFENYLSASAVVTSIVRKIW